jgi:ubiquinone/menaquinone biosynthesis C-methylase UbiE
MDVREYNLRELRIAMSPGDPRRAMPPIDPRTDHTILDVGCGAGQTLIASALPPETVRVGIDIDRPGLALGRDLDASILFVCGRGETLPFRDRSFDLVIARVSLPYMRTDPALTEMCRVLRPGGRIWMTLHHASYITHLFAHDVAHLDLPRAMYRLYVLTNGVMSHLFGIEFALPVVHRRESFQTRRGMANRLRALGCDDIRMELAQSVFTVSARKQAVDGA